VFSQLASALPLSNEKNLYRAYGNSLLIPKPLSRLEKSKEVTSIELILPFSQFQSIRAFLYGIFLSPR
jgi:hypothetical protein